MSDRRLVLFVFALLVLFCGALCLLSLRWGLSDADDPPLLGRLGLFILFMLIGQWSVFQFLNYW